MKINKIEAGGLSHLKNNLLEINGFDAGACLKNWNDKKYSARVFYLFWFYKNHSHSIRIIFWFYLFYFSEFKIIFDTEDSGR